ncbi:hypothetical protein LCGC14_2094740, partial [marine sediment metagenome]
MAEIIPTPPDRAEELYDLTAKVFRGGGYHRFLRHCRDTYYGGSCYDWQVSRVAMADGMIVSHVGVWRYRMRVGRARLLTGGIGAVMTHGDYRKRGLSAETFKATMASMREAGYDFTMLGGIRDFYDRLGLCPVIPRITVRADVKELSVEGLRLRLVKTPVVRANCGPGPIQRIYKRENATRTGTAERPLYTRPWHALACWTLNDAAGRVRGYVVAKASGDDLCVHEIGGLGRRCGLGQLIAAIRTLARRARCRRVVTWDLSYTHPLCVALRAGTCRVEMRHERSGGMMAAVVNLRGCLTAMQGELSDRLAASTMSRYRGILSVEAAGEKVPLQISSSRVRVVDTAARSADRIVAGPEIARLLLGSESPAVLAAQSGIRFTGSADKLAEALLPAQWPMHYTLDHY